MNDQEKNLSTLTYAALLADLKVRIGTAQTRAALSVNREMIRLYWEIGKTLAERQEREGWGAKVVDRLAADLKNELPGIQGFSARNMNRMKAFYAAYPEMTAPRKVTQNSENTGENILPQAVAEIGESTQYSGNLILPQVAAELAETSLSLPWGHNILLIEKVKDLDQRRWYMRQTIEHGWSRAVLTHQIGTKLFERQGSAPSNFDRTLPPPQSDLAVQTLKDPYVFDFLTLDADARERDLERGLVAHIRDFLLELGVGFAFVGQQVHMEVGDQDFCLDLLFYHLKLRCYVVIELKTTAFKPEHAGQLNFYLSAVDDLMRHGDDQPTIGIMICKTRDNVVAEYALRGMSQPIGIAEYETGLAESLPPSLKGSLPEIEELEAELSGSEEPSDE